MVQLVWAIPKVDMNTVQFHGSLGIIPIAFIYSYRVCGRIELSTKFDRQLKRGAGKTISLEN